MVRFTYGAHPRLSGGAWPCRAGGYEKQGRQAGGRKEMGGDPRTTLFLRRCENDGSGRGDV
jgi:hypothetical protein